MPRIYVALDLETTGLSSELDAILEIGAVKFRGEDTLDTWCSLVNPQRRIPPNIQRLTGITQDEVDRAPVASQILPSLRRFISSSTLLGHSVGFDLSFLKREGLSFDQVALDTFELASILLPHVPRYSLQRLADEFEIPAPVAHRALADAFTTADLFRVLRRKAEQLCPQMVQEIGRMGGRSEWPLAQFFQDVVRDRSRAFLSSSIGRQLMDKRVLDGLGSAQLLVRRDQLDPPLRPVEQPIPLDPQALASLLDVGGVFARQFSGYEYRPQQVQMLRAVSAAFTEQHHLLAEAGTGTGKSMAYLLPAVRFAQDNSEHVVVSTNTINLQDQLFGKDIPDLQQLLGTEVRAVVLKGRTNYLCLDRLRALRRRGRLSPTEARVLAKILVWMPSTLTGDRAELFLPTAGERAVWAQVASDHDTCLGEGCRFHQQGQCFFYSARESAERAHIIVVNHALLLSDISVENRVLPEYHYLIIDEAHNLESTVTRQLSFEVNQAQLERLLASLSQEVAPGRYAGLITQLSLRLRDALSFSSASNTPGRISSHFGDSVQESQLGQHILGIQSAVDEARRGTRNLFSALSGCLNQHRGPDGGYAQRIRLTSGMRAQPAWDEVEIAGDNATLQLRDVSHGIRSLMQWIDDLGVAEVTDCEELVQEVLLRGGEIHSTTENLRSLLVEPQDNDIYWATIPVPQTRGEQEEVSLHSAPLHVGELVDQHLFHSKRTVVLTSATLQTEGSFDYIRERLHAWNASELAVGSPFDFQSSTLLCLPTDIPEPGQPYHQKQVETALTLVCRALEGRTLVLFTSYSQLNSTARSIAGPLAEANISVFAQGQGTSRRQLLENFRTNARSVLLGTSSFWEGVDVVGEALSCVVIVKLPFSVPTDPIIAARSETFEEPFGQYAVPQAILRLRQGFGRLIRSKSDRGVVLVLDRRLQTKFYGQAFLDSLPQCAEWRGCIAELPGVAKRWLTRQKTNG